MQLHVGIARPEVANPRRNARLEIRRPRESDADVPGLPSRDLLHATPDTLHTLQNQPRLGQERLAQLGQHDIARQPHKQRPAQLRFQLPDLQTQRRLLYAHARRRPREMTLFRDSNEVLQMPQFHNRSPVSPIPPGFDPSIHKKYGNTMFNILEM